jgi:hypothetical protein
MKRFSLTVAVSAILFGCSGCVSGNWQGLVPGKDVHLKNFKQEITTPWGHTLITADSLDTSVAANGTIPPISK